MSISNNRGNNYKEGESKQSGLISLKLFPKKFHKTNIHNINLKKETELTFTKENIKNLFGNKLSVTTKNSPNSSMYYMETTNNLEFSFSNNNNNNFIFNEQEHSNKETQNEISLSYIESKIDNIIEQNKIKKQSITMCFDDIDIYLQVLEQVILIIKNSFTEYALLEKIYIGLKDHFGFIKNKYMKMNKKLKDIEKYKIVDLKKEKKLLFDKDDIRNTNQGINFIDSINIYEDNSFHYKESEYSKMELESIYFRDKVLMKKTRSSKSIKVPKLDLSFHINKSTHKNQGNNNIYKHNKRHSLNKVILNKPLNPKHKYKHSYNNETILSNLKQKPKQQTSFSYITTNTIQHK